MPSKQLNGLDVTVLSVVNSLSPRRLRKNDPFVSSSKTKKKQRKIHPVAPPFLAPPSLTSSVTSRVSKPLRDGRLQFRAIDVKKFRESEVKHARLAMLAFAGMFVQELAHPLFDTGARDLGPAIYHFQAISKVFPLMPALLLVNIGILEGNNIFGA